MVHGREILSIMEVKLRFPVCKISFWWGIQLLFVIEENGVTTFLNAKVTFNVV